MQNKLARIADSDPLTGVLNRRAFSAAAEKELRRGRRYGTDFSILLLDIDRFKEINDTQGHEVGDNVLKQFARLVENTLRDVDLFARWGGEEFIALLPMASLEAARIAAERVRLMTEKYAFQAREGKTLSVTVSIGISYSADNDEDLKELIKRADDALYTAKTNGRNQVVDRVRNS